MASYTFDPHTQFLGKKITWLDRQNDHPDNIIETWGTVYYEGQKNNYHFDLYLNLGGKSHHFLVTCFYVIYWFDHSDKGKHSHYVLDVNGYHELHGMEQRRWGWKRHSQFETDPRSDTPVNYSNLGQYFYQDCVDIVNSLPSMDFDWLSQLSMSQLVELRKYMLDISYEKKENQALYLPEQQGLNIIDDQLFMKKKSL